MLEDTREALANLHVGLNALDDAMRQLKLRRTGGIVTMTASQAIAAKWLLPHLGDFAMLYPNIVVRLDARPSRLRGKRSFRTTLPMAV